MNTLLFWTGVVVWFTALAVAFVWLMVLVGQMLWRWVYFTRLKDEYSRQWVGRHSGSLASGARPSMFVRLPFSRHALVVVFASERRWKSRWPTILLPHCNFQTGEHVPWTPFRHLYVTDSRHRGERESSLTHRFTAEVLFACEAAGVTVVSATGVLPADPVGAAPTVVVAYAAEMTSEVAAAVRQAIRNGCVVVYVDDRPTVIEDEGDGFPPIVFQFPVGHRTIRVQVSDDGRVFEAGCPYLWRAGSVDVKRDDAEAAGE